MNDSSTGKLIVKGDFNKCTTIFLDESNNLTETFVTSYIYWDFQAANNQIVKADINFSNTPIPLGSFTKKQGS